MRQRRVHPVRRRAVALLAASVLVASCETDGGNGDAAPEAEPTTTTVDGATTTTVDAGPGANDRDPAARSLAALPDLVASASPSVVAVRRADGAGSGVIWNDDGLIVTNAHVVQGAEQVDLSLADGSTLRGTVRARDPRTDLAVIEVGRRGLPPLPLADEPPPVGTPVVAIGNPLGFENSATFGIISGLARAIPGSAAVTPALVDLVQTDAPISPGNSGGALVDLEGRLVGITVAFIPPEARAVSIGFAVPIDTVRDVVEQLVTTGTVQHAFLGVGMRTLSPQVAARFGLAVDRGAVVVDVAPGSPAADAGLASGDVLVRAGQQPVGRIEDVLTAIRRRSPGDELELGLYRPATGEELTVTVTLAVRPPT